MTTRFTPRVGALTPDPILRHHYGGQLEAAAETFLLGAFEQASGGQFNEGVAPVPALVSAAMSILTRSAWTQPSDEQVKASVFLGQRETMRPAGEDPALRAA